MIYIKILLSPILLIVATVYWTITFVRNKLFDWGLKPSETFSIPTISVGNLSMGGTGKTPMVEHLIRILSEQYKVVTLSRGYGRKTRGYIHASKQNTADDIGDEPCQIKSKFNNIEVVVDEKRVNAMTQIVKNKLGDVVILDDAYQHRYVKPGLSILLTEFNKPYFKDCILPFGRLRESKIGRKRADIIVVTKTPLTVNEKTLEQYTKRLKADKNQYVLFSSIKYNNSLTSIFNNKTIDVNTISNFEIILVTGIANPQPLIEYITPLVSKIKHINFSDHYDFKHKDIEDILINFDALNCSDKLILTTEKDAVRLKQFRNTDISHSDVYYIDIAVNFLNINNLFKSKILEYVRKN